MKTNSQFLLRQARKVSHRQGAGLMEMTFVLLIIITIIGGALALARGAMSQSTVAQEIQVLTNLSGSVYKTRTTRGYSDQGDLTSTLRFMGLIPANVTDMGGEELRNSWNGQISISHTDGAANFSITYENIPQEECIQMLMGVKSGILNSVGSGTTSTKNIRDIAPSDGQAMCSNTSGNQITWDSQVLASNP